MSDIPDTIIYVDNAPIDPCATCIMNDHCAMHEEDRCEEGASTWDTSSQ